MQLSFVAAGTRVTLSPSLMPFSRGSEASLVSKPEDLTFEQELSDASQATVLSPFAPRRSRTPRFPFSSK